MSLIANWSLADPSLGHFDTGPPQSGQYQAVDHAVAWSQALFYIGTQLAHSTAEGDPIDAQGFLFVPRRLQKRMLGIFGPICSSVAVRKVHRCSSTTNVIQENSIGSSVG